jgi:HK97 family phage major capsid protein
METGLETKVMTEGTDGLFGVMQAFEAFKEANDERLGQIERRMSSDVVTAEKVERINKALDDLTLKLKRPQLGASEKAQPTEHKRAFESYVRKGESRGLSEIEAKSMSVTSNPDGGFLVPAETEAEIGRIISNASPIRAISDVRQVSASVYNKPFATTGVAAGWAAENGARPETASQNLAQMQFPTMELYAMPAATQALLDDSVVNLDQWLGQEVQTVFAEQESQAFVAGNGISKPKGFTDYAKQPDATWSWNTIGYIATGVAGAFAASNPSDKLIDLIYALKAGYRQNANWVMNRKTQSAIRKFKDGQGNYLWAPPASADGKASLMNFPVTESEHMPDIGTDTFAIAVGDFKQGYLIVDRVGLRILRDPYSSKPYVLFYTTKRVGGGVQNFEAIKLMKFGVS